MYAKVCMCAFLLAITPPPPPPPEWILHQIPEFDCLTSRRVFHLKFLDSYADCNWLVLYTPLFSRTVIFAVLATPSIFVISMEPFTDILL